MQANQVNGDGELLCINTEKVYDWILNEATFDLTIDDIELPIVNGTQLTCDDIDTVTCEVETNATEVLNREDRPYVIDGTPITLQLVTIQKNFDVTIIINTTAGQTVEAGTFPFTRCEQVVLCAPDNTSVNVTYTDVDCFVCVFNCDDVTPGVGTLDVGVTVRLCQSIQSTFPVTLEIFADFCEPREVLPIVSGCPAPTMPPQCPVLFPNNNGDD